MDEAEVMHLITQSRINAGMTKTQLAYKAKVHYVSLLLWESGKSLPTLTTLKLLADAMDLKIILQFKPKK